MLFRSDRPLTAVHSTIGASVAIPFVNEERSLGWMVNPSHSRQGGMADDQIPVAIQFLPAVGIFTMVPFSPGKSMPIMRKRSTSEAHDVQNRRDGSSARAGTNKRSRISTASVPSEMLTRVLQSSRSKPSNTPWRKAVVWNRVNGSTCSTRSTEEGRPSCKEPTNEGA